MTQKNYGLLIDPEKFDAAITKIEEQQLPFGFDIETGYDGPPKQNASLNCEDPVNKLAGASFTPSLEWARYLPVHHDLGPNMEELAFAELWWRLLNTGLGVPHNASFEERHLATFFRKTLWNHPTLGPEVKASDGYFPIRSDTLIELYLEAELRIFKLKQAVYDKYGHKMTELIDLFPDLPANQSKSLRFTVLESSRPDAIAYACEDSLWTLALHQDTYPKVKDRFLYKVEMAVMPLVCAMEDFGLQYDWPEMARVGATAEFFLERMGREITEDLSVALDRAVTINLGSPKQLQEVLYNPVEEGGLGLTTTRRSKKTKKPSTDAQALAGLAKQHPVVKRILEWKEMRKLLGTYLRKYEAEYSYAPDGRTHPNTIQTGTITGRFAVTAPPYQQTPKKYNYKLRTGEEFKLDFRNFIIAPAGYYILGFDYSQVELRVMAGEAQEPSLLAAFRKAEDVHVTTASLMLNVPKDEVTDDQRSVGKTMNFALLYGMGAKSLAEKLGIDKAEAEQLYEQFFSAYSAISVWSQRQEESGKEKGYTHSRMGRRHTIWELLSDDDYIYSKGERMCVNCPIQGGAADYMKVSMVRADKALREANLIDKVHLVMNIHDALEYYVREDVDPQEVIDVLLPAVTPPIKDYPPIVAEWHIGQKWGSVRKLKLGGDGQILGEDEKDDEKDTPPAELFPSPTMNRNQPWSEIAPDFLSPTETEQAKAALNRVTWQPGLDYVGDVWFDAGLPHPMETESGMEGRCIHCGKTRSPLHKAAVAMTQSEQSPEEAQSGRTVHIRIRSMPQPEQFQDFVQWMEQHPGINQVVLETPEGPLPMDNGTALDLNDQGAVSLILGGAELYYPVENVSVEDITVGMDL